ncbi:MAG: sugar phosphate isomerase/epimerase family protein [Opitutaceae bacterium]|nr:sugar phosphate isomerase/epimerase family protein [Opitutaceae bacterium]
MNLSRRSFVQRTLGLGVATALVRPSFAAKPAAANSTATGFKIFACDWTIQKSCNPEAFELAARIGLDGVQVDFGRVKESSAVLPLFDQALQEKILAASRQHGVAISSLALGVLNNIPYKSEAATEQWVLDSVGVMKRMGTRVCLLAFFSKGDLVDDPAGTAEVIRRLKKLAPRAEAAGIVYGLESWLKVPELERILDAVKSPALQVYYDVGNMQKVGEDVGAAIRRLGRERICEIHLKDYDDLYGKGSMNFPAVRSALDAIGYRGWLGIEGTKLPLGPEKSVRYDLDYLRPIFPKTI